MILWIGPADWEQKEQSYFSAKVIIISSSRRDNKDSRRKDMKYVSDLLCFPGIFSGKIFDLGI